MDDRKWESCCQRHMARFGMGSTVPYRHSETGKTGNAEVISVGHDESRAWVYGKVRQT